MMDWKPIQPSQPFGQWQLGEAQALTLNRMKRVEKNGWMLYEEEHCEKKELFSKIRKK